MSPCQCSDKTIVGLTEKITVKGERETVELIARIDTGATKSSIDIALANQIGYGVPIDTKTVKSAHGTRVRPVVQLEINLKGKTIKAKFTIADRNEMKYQILIGQNILKKNFLIDPSFRADPPIKEAAKEQKESKEGAV